MGTRVPVYSDTSGVPLITIYEESGDGTFRRTSDKALLQLRDYIVGISPAIGELVSNRFDRGERPWQSPTALTANRRPRSYYAFLRECVKERRLVVMTTPTLSGSIHKFPIHELQLKPATPTAVFSLMADKYLEALDIDRHGPQQPAEQKETPETSPNRPSAVSSPSRNVRELTPRLRRLLES